MAATFAEQYSMIISKSLEQIPSLKPPIGLTIGTFDGVHLGHQSLFCSLREKVSSQGTVAALTFSNHPSELFNGHAPTLQLCTLEHKLKLLQAFGVDFVLLLPFDQQLAKKPFDLFLQDLKSHIGFSYLVLGEEASFGKNREGKPEAVKALASRLQFQVEYIAKTQMDKAPVSSGRIRKALQMGNFDAVEALLGRPYSILIDLEQCPLRNGSIPLSNLCLPPPGEYRIQVKTTQTTIACSAILNSNQLSFQYNCSNPIELKGLIEIFFLQNS